MQEFFSMGNNLMLLNLLLIRSNSLIKKIYNPVIQEITGVIYFTITYVAYNIINDAKVPYITFIEGLYPNAQRV